MCSPEGDGSGLLVNVSQLCDMKMTVELGWEFEGVIARLHYIFGTDAAERTLIAHMPGHHQRGKKDGGQSTAENARNAAATNPDLLHQIHVHLEASLGGSCDAGMKPLWILHDRENHCGPDFLHGHAAVTNP